MPADLDPRRRRYWRLAGLMAASVTILMAMGLAGPILVVSAQLEQPDAIISLASHEWERLPVAGQLALKYPRAQVLLTLPPKVNRHRCHDCEHRADYLVSLGVQRQRIHVVALSESSTRGEARAIRRVVEDSHVRQLVIVTSAYHTRRALRTFRTELKADGLVIGVVPAGAGTFAHPMRWWSHPYDRWYVSYEWTALMRDTSRQLIGMLMPAKDSGSITRTRTR